MGIPNQQITTRDPGLGIVEPGAVVPLFQGTANSGTDNEVVSVSEKQAAITQWGQGPLAEAICRQLDIAGGPVLGQRLNDSVAGASGAVTSTRVSTSTGTVTVTVDVAYDRYEVIIEVVDTGGVGIGTFRYSLDDGRTYSETITIPSGGAYVIANTGLTVTFADLGGPILFEDGDLFEFDTTAPYYTTSDLGAAFTQLLLETTDYDYIVLLGKPATTSDGATMFATFATNLTSLETNFVYVGGVMDAGDDTTANAISDFAASTSARISPCYGDADMASSKPFTGYGSPKQSLVLAVAPRYGDIVMSTDPARFADGPLTGILEISHDERLVEVLDQHKFTTLRTWIGAAGFYITNGRMKSALGSDFVYWQHRRMMDEACSTVYKGQLQFISAGLRTNEGTGTIDVRDAIRWEEQIKDRLDALLLQPQNAEGTPGHVSAFNYTINRNNNVLTSQTLLTTVAIRPLGYVKDIETDIGFAINVGG